MTKAKDVVQRAYPAAGRACPNCGGPVGQYTGGTDTHCLAGCGYRRSVGDDEARHSERAAYVETQTCWECGE